MKELKGRVSSISGKNTVRVSVSRRWTHPLYKKSVKRTKNYLCHFDAVELEVGDEVLIRACVPVSKQKHFVVVKKIEASGNRS